MSATRFSRRTACGSAYDSDETGENELYVRPQDGTGDPLQLTKGADTYY